MCVQVCIPVCIGTPWLFAPTYQALLHRWPSQLIFSPLVVIGGADLEDCGRRQVSSRRSLRPLLLLLLLLLLMLMLPAHG